MPHEISCRVYEILEHGERVYSLFLEPETPAPRFKPGQFLKLALDAHAAGEPWPDSRSFSISSSPLERTMLRITYAVKGLFTTRMEAELHEGSRVWLQMPFGEFNISKDRDVCLLAGGTGVTAFTAFMAGLRPRYPQKVYLFYGARRPDLLIYRSLVEAAKRLYPDFQVYYLADHGSLCGDCLPGRIEAEIVLKLVKDPLSLTYYLAGPPGMIRDLTSELSHFGVARQQIIADAWDKL